MEQPSYRYLINIPGVRGGHTIIEGTRIAVHDVIGLLQNGETVDSVVSNMVIPDLTKAQVYECLAYYVDHKAEIDVLIARQSSEPKLRSGPQTIEDRRQQVANLRAAMERLNALVETPETRDGLKEAMAQFNEELGADLVDDLPLLVEFRAFTKENGRMAIELSIDPTDPETLTMIRDQIKS